MLNRLIASHQDSGILEERKWAWWKRILAMPEKMANMKIITKEPRSSHLKRNIVTNKPSKIMERLGTMEPRSSHLKGNIVTNEPSKIMERLGTKEPRSSNLKDSIITSEPRSSKLHGSVQLMSQVLPI
jgi:hypothetical protein